MPGITSDVGPVAAIVFPLEGEPTILTSTHDEELLRRIFDDLRQRPEWHALLLRALELRGWEE